MKTSRIPLIEQVTSTTAGGFRLEIQGRVQGVGFRPHVWRIATSLGLRGEVFNTYTGVEIRLRCSPVEQKAFVHDLLGHLPPQAQVASITVEPFDSGNDYTAFNIQPSISTSRAVSLAVVSPDLATCPDCLSELFDPHNRRYRYPFINCTQCGPRLSIIDALPYDRIRTSMAGFQLCQACADEYADPSSRRFHAEPNACADCGPTLWLESAGGNIITAANPFTVMARALQEGQILALKGIGGFHLCCDARNAHAVKRLRQRKRRPDKALAVMFGGGDQLRQYITPSPEESELLTSTVGPIILCRSGGGRRALAAEVAPDSAWVGCMLPYTPLHHLLMAAVDGPLVMTSANCSGLPQVIDNQSARDQLSGMADLLVLHDRAIRNRVDDTVMRVPAGPGSAEVLRPGRGVSPLCLPLPDGFETVTELLAMGGDLKNTFCLAKGDHVVMSPYQGDLQEVAIGDEAASARLFYRQLYQLNHERLACDRHPDYASTQTALAISAGPMALVQHHHAHLAACLGEHGYPLDGEPVLALCLDGNGYGDNGELWGGEWLYGGYCDAKRLASFQPCALPGGELAIREPWRVLVAQLLQAGIDPLNTLDIWPWLKGKPLATITRMIELEVNAPVSSSVGRIFDAMAAALCCYADGISYEGQAAITLESLAWQKTAENGFYSGSCDRGRNDSRALGSAESYRFVIRQRGSTWLLSAQELWPQVIADLRAGRSASEMAWAFHRGLVDGLVDMTFKLHRTHGFETLVLSGGVMQNLLLVEQLEQRLGMLGIDVLRHHQIPCNDSGLSFGQALVALALKQQGV